MILKLDSIIEEKNSSSDDSKTLAFISKGCSSVTNVGSGFRRILDQWGRLSSLLVSACEYR